MRSTMSILIALCVAASLALCACGAKKKTDKDKDALDSNAPVPVSVADVKQQDVPIYLDGLGTVQAFNSATIRAQVSGQLMAVPFKEGDEVKAGSVIARVDPRSFQAQLDEALAKKGQDEASLGSAQLDMKRYMDLLPDGYVSGQQVDQQRATVKQLEAQVTSDEAAIENARVSLSFCTITAPFDGVLGIRQVDVGNLVSAADATGIAVMTQIRPIAVTFTLPEQVLQSIQAAGAAQSASVGALTAIALSRDNQAELARGRVMAIDNQIDQTTGTIKLKASFSNQSRSLWPGEFVNMRLLVSTRHDGLVVPSVAVQRGPEGAFVYLTKDNQTVQMRAVKVAQTEDGLSLIDAGLQAGDRVVTDGQYRLQEGSKIVLAQAPAAAPSAAVGSSSPGSQ